MYFKKSDGRIIGIGIFHYGDKAFAETAKSLVLETLREIPSVSKRQHSLGKPGFQS